MSGTRYMYAVARAFRPDRIAGLGGVDGAAVHLVGHHGLVAVVSPAPRLDESELQARLERLDELEAIARAHHAVVSAVAAHTVTAPLRLGTIHSGDGRVVEVLRHGYADFSTLLDRLAGRVELGVKLYLDAAEPDPEPTGTASGRDYLRRLGKRRRQHDEAWHDATSAAERVHAILAAHAVQHSRHRPQPAQLTGTAGVNLLNLAYLVASGRAGAFIELARRLGTRLPDLRIEVTGPWPAYSFADLDPEPSLVDTRGGSGP